MKNTFIKYLKFSVDYIKEYRRSKIVERDNNLNLEDTRILKQTRKKWLSRIYKLSRKKSLTRQEIEDLEQKNTDLEQTNKKLLEKNLKLTQFKDAALTWVQTINHDIRNQLNGSIGLMDIMNLNPSLLTEETKVFLGIMHKQLHNIKDYVQEMSNDVFEKDCISAFSLNSLVSEIADLQSVQIQLAGQSEPSNRKEAYTPYAPNIVLRVNADENINSNKLKVKNALNNIIGNAVKALTKNYSQNTNKREFIDIDIKIEDFKKYIISIKDYAGGLGEAYEQNPMQIFEDSKARGRRGLLIVTDSIKKVGGSIEVKTEDGVGTEFILKIPRQATTKAIAQK